MLKNSAKVSFMISITKWTIIDLPKMHLTNLSIPHALGNVEVHKLYKILSLRLTLFRGRGERKKERNKIGVKFF